MANVKNLGAALLFELLGTGILATSVNIYQMTMTSDVMLFVALNYFCAMIIATPISGGHLNPIITVGTWIAATGCNTKEIGTMLLMILAQILGGIFGLTMARSMRVITQHGEEREFYPPYAPWKAPCENTLTADL